MLARMVWGTYLEKNCPCSKGHLLVLARLNASAFVALETEQAGHLGGAAPLVEVVVHRTWGEVATGPGGHQAQSWVVLREAPPLAGGCTGLLRELNPGPLAP